MTFGERLRQLHRESGLSTHEIAKRLGVTRHAVYQYESGISTPSLDRILELERIFGLHGGELIRISAHADVAFDVARALNQEEVESA